MRRTLSSLFGGLLATVLSVVAGSAGLYLLRSDLDGGIGSRGLPAAEWIILELLVIVLGGVTGGYVTAAIAQGSTVRNALMLAALVAVAGSAALVVDAPSGPLFWYRLGSIGAIVPAVAMGGAMRADSTRRSRRMGEAEPRTA